MKKTVFVGKVNDQEFDNVQDYNACVQAMIDMGKDFQATSSTQVVEVPEDDCECTCSGKAKKLKALPQYTPAYEDRNDGVYIDKILNEDDNIFAENMNNLEKNLTDIYNFITNAIPHSDNTPDHLEAYGEVVNEMSSILNRDLEKTTKSQESIKNRIHELEEELEMLYNTSIHLEKAEDVINIYQEFYDAVGGALVQHASDKCPHCECNDEVCTCDKEVTDEQVQEAARRLTTGFARLLREILEK